MKNIGLWIDHKKATLVIQTEHGENIQQIESEVGRHVHYRGASNSKSPFSAQYQQGETGSFFIDYRCNVIIEIIYHHIFNGSWYSTTPVIDIIPIGCYARPG